MEIYIDACLARFAFKVKLPEGPGSGVSYDQRFWDEKTHVTTRLGVTSQCSGIDKGGDIVELGNAFLSLPGSSAHFKDRIASRAFLRSASPSRQLGPPSQGGFPTTTSNLPLKSGAKEFSMIRAHTPSRPG